MSDVSSTLSVRIETGQAAASLLGLQKGLEGAALGVAKLGREIQNHSGNIQRVLGELSKHGFGGLSASLSSETTKVGAGMRALEKEVEQAAARSGKKAGAALSEGIREGVTGVGAHTRHLVQYFELVSREARASSSHIKSVIEASTVLRARQDGDHRDLLAMYRRLETSIGAVEAAERNFAVTTSTRVKSAVAGLTAENAELAKMRAHYEALQREGTLNVVKSFEGGGASRRGLQSAISANTGAGLDASGMTAQYRDGVSAFGKVLAETGGAADKSRGAMARWSDEAKMVHDTARGAAAGVGYLWMTWGNIGAMAAGFSAVKGLGAGVTELVNIEQQLTHAAQAGGGTVESLSARIGSMYGNGQKMMHTQGQLAEALKNLTLAGFSTDEAFQMLTHTYKFAAAGEMDLAAAAQGVQQTMNSFRLPMSETGRVTDVLAKAAAASAVTIEDMVQAMKTGSVVGAMYNVSIEDFAKSAALLGKVGITGQAAGTAIKNFYTELSSPKSKKADVAMKELGLSFYQLKDGQKVLKPLSGIIDELREKFRSLSGTDQQGFLQSLNTIFNERGIKEAAQLIKMTEGEYSKLNDMVANSAGFVDTLYGKLSNTTQGVFTNLKAQGLAALTGALEAAAPAIKELGEALTKLVTSSGFKEFLSTSIGLLTGLTRLITEHGTELMVILAFYKGTAVISGMFELMGRGWAGVITKLATANTLLGGQGMLGSVQAVSTAVGDGGATGLAGRFSRLGSLIGRIFGIAGIAYTVFVTFKGLTESVLGEERIQRWGDALGKAFARTMNDIDKIRLKMAEARGDTAGAADLRKQIDIRSMAHLDPREELVRAEQAYSSLSAQNPANRKYLLGGPDKYQLDAFNKRLADAKAEVDRLKAQVKEMDDALARSKKAEADAAAAAAKKQEPPTADPKYPDAPPLPGTGGTAKKATSPLSVVDYSAEIKLYSANLQEIGKIEQDALNRSKTLWQAGLGTEQAYLDERNAIRAKADSDAKAQLDAYVAAQNAAAGAAEKEYLKQVSEAQQLGLMNDEATLNKIKTAANRIEEAYAKAAQAVDQYNARAQQRSDGQALDVLAGMKEKYGNPDEDLRKAKEYNRALDEQITRAKGLSKVTQDSHIVFMEGSVARQNALINEAWANAEILNLTYEQIDALYAKRDASAGELDKYKVGKVKEFLAGREGVSTDKDTAEIEKVKAQYAQMQAVVLASTETEESEKTALILRLTEERNRQVAALESQRLQNQLGSAESLFKGLAGMAKAFGGEQSKSYKALFAVSKAFAVAQAGISLQTALAKELEKGWPMSLAGMATVAAQGASLISAITSSNFAGAFDSGGDIPSGMIGLVGERGPELIQGPARVTSRVETARMMNGGGGASAPAAPPVVNVRNINVLDPAVVGDYLATDDGEQMIMNVVQRNQGALGR